MIKYLIKRFLTEDLQMTDIEIQLLKFDHLQSNSHHSGCGYVHRCPSDDYIGDEKLIVALRNELAESLTEVHQLKRELKKVNQCLSGNRHSGPIDNENPYPYCPYCGRGIHSSLELMGG